MIDDGPVRELLRSSDLEIEGQLRAASNTTVRCLVADPAGGVVRCVYKPLSGERPLWDFADGTLGRREVATYALAQALGWRIIPPTTWRDDGPLGPGMVQLWIDEIPESPLIDLVSPQAVPDGWAVVLEGEDAIGQPIVLAHSRDERLLRLAVLDVIVNNADRKGGHVLVDRSGGLWGIDHGVTLAAEEKLRTVLWGWADEPIPEDLLRDITAVLDAGPALPDEVMRALDRQERRALTGRMRELVDTGSMPAIPAPEDRWPVIPWPVF